ncbi:MAG: DUF1697 domain-containing protein [Maribacter sp.]|uniref:DUF1697 domain-containing protein n=1 Tax=Maribacter sp. TaxID=1897614 RepID=UPI003C772AE6
MTYIAFLRGINVGGHKKIKMADLRSLMENIGFHDVLTYIQSGNLIFKSDIPDHRDVESKISKTILDHYGFDVAVVVKKRFELMQFLGKNPFKFPEDIKDNKVYFVLLKNEPEQEGVEALSAMQFDNEHLVITPTCVYLKCNLGAGKAKCNNNLIARKLKVDTTSRNHRTLMKILELSGD